MSKHECLVIKIEKILPHPDPETVSLGVVEVFGEGGYKCVVNKNQWKEGDLAAYVEPDTIVSGFKEEFSFLNGSKPPKKHRIKAKRLRGVWSEGLLVPVSSFNVGDDVWAHFELERYEPHMSRPNGSRKANLDANFGTGGGWVEAPVKLPFQKYDIENLRKHSNKIDEGDEVVVMEKIHGCNFRGTYQNDQLFVGSQSGWRGNTIVINTPEGEQKTIEVSNTWNEAAKQNPWFEELCKANPDLVFFGEAFGQVQDLKYGAGKNQVFLRLFDAFSVSKREFLNWKEFSELVKLEQMAPVLFVGPYTKQVVADHTDGQSLIPGADHIREGCVVKPTVEKFKYNLGRVILKSVSNFYLERP